MPSKFDQVFAKLEALAPEITHMVGGDKEPLDGDQTQLLAEIFLLHLDDNQGNISHREYEELLAEIKKLWAAKF